MQNFADGINPNQGKDSAERRNWKVVREALTELCRQVASISTKGQTPNPKVETTTLVNVQDNIFTIYDNADLTKRARFNLANVPSNAITEYYLPAAGGTLVTSASLYKWFVWHANGPYRVDTYVDGAIVVPFNLAIDSVYLYRRAAGTSGTTTVDVNVNGSTIYASSAKPHVHSSDGDYAAITCGLPDSDKRSVTAGQWLSIDTDEIEGGTPEDYTLIIRGA